MRVTLPLLRIPPARAPILRYGVAVLSTALALIPTILLADVPRKSSCPVRRRCDGQRLVRRGWKPGVVATAFALTVSAYFSLAGEHTPAQLQTAIIRLSLFFLSPWRFAGSTPPQLRAREPAPLGVELPFAGHQRSPMASAVVTPPAKFWMRTPRSSNCLATQPLRI